MSHYGEGVEPDVITPAHIVAAIAIESNTLKQHSATVEQVTANLKRAGADAGTIFRAIGHAITIGVIKYEYGCLTIQGAT